MCDFYGVPLTGDRWVFAYTAATRIDGRWWWVCSDECREVHNTAKLLVGEDWWGT